MNHFESLWNVLAPILFVFVFILGLIIMMRISQKVCKKIVVRLSFGIKELYTGNGLPLAKSEQGCSSFLHYLSLILGSFLGIIITGFFVGIIMLFAVSELFSAINISIFPSFVSSAFEWAALTISGILLFFLGLYGSRLTSYYIHKLPSPRAHTFAQVASLGLLTFFIFMSLNRIGSAVQIINVSLLIVTFSFSVSLILPLFKTKNLSPNLKTTLHKIV